MNVQGIEWNSFVDKKIHKVEISDEYENGKVSVFMLSERVTRCERI